MVLADYLYLDQAYRADVDAVSFSSVAVLALQPPIDWYKRR